MSVPARPPMPVEPRCGTLTVPVPRLPHLLVVLAAVSVALTALSYLGLVSGHPLFVSGEAGHRLVDVGTEANIPTWWSATLLSLGAAGCLARGARRDPLDSPGSTGFAWFACAAGLAALSLDELASIHELLFVAGDRLAPGAFAFSWLVIGIPLALALAAGAVLVARRLPRRARALLLGGLAVFLIGAVGLEWLGSELTARDAYGTRLGVAAYHLEELAEMLGAALMCLSPLSGSERARNVAHPTPAGGVP